MTVKVSRVHVLHELLVESVIAEMEQCKSDNIPLSGPLMNTALSILKMNEVTAEPDEQRLEALRNEFASELATARTEKAKRILEDTDSLTLLMN